MAPPAELNFTDTLETMFQAVYVPSQDLIDNVPRVLLLGASVQFNWQESGLPDPQAQTIATIRFSARPVAPSMMDPLILPSLEDPTVLDPTTATISDMIQQLYSLSQDLIDNVPRCLFMYADRLQINWQQSGLADPGSQSIIDLQFTCRPVAPSTMTIYPHDPYAEIP
jgi:hypothetical protein